jgi:hypothetical protein
MTQAREVKEPREPDPPTLTQAIDPTTGLDVSLEVSAKITPKLITHWKLRFQCLMAWKK